MRYVDTETCGFHGPTVLIQHAVGLDGKVQRHNVWKSPIIETLELIEEICAEGIVGFNLTFDWFHLQQTYNVLALLMEKVGPDELPEDHINAYANLEPEARNGVCIKPITALDLLLHARKGPYQSTMDRKDIRIKRVPKVLAQKLCDELNKRVPLREIYFARAGDKQKRWYVSLIKGDNDFVNIELKFRPSSALKALAVDALNKKEDVVLKLGDVGVSKKFQPAELGWAPFALALSDESKMWWAKIKKNGKIVERRTWPGVIKHHIDHWEFDPKAIKYSIDDVVYLQELHPFFGMPEPGDDDSVLACMVGSVRWRGFTFDKKKIQALRDDAEKRSKAAPMAPHHVKKYLGEVMAPEEYLAIKDSTKRVVLETVSKLEIDCPKCNGEGCTDCKNTGGAPHPAAIRAAKCLDSRKARNERTMYEKLLQAGKFHVSLKVIGTLSGRVAGTDGLNATGIQHQKAIRSAFTLGDDQLILAGGDFEAFEVSIADARYNDEELRTQLLTCWVCKQPRIVTSFDELFCPHCKVAQTTCKNCQKPLLSYQDGTMKCKCDKPAPKGELENTLRKIHGLFGQELVPGLTYDDVLETKGQVPDLYDQGKRGVFSQLYGGNYNTLMTRLGIDEETAKQAEQGFASRYPGVGLAKQEIYDKFCSMRQPEGIGSQVYWADPHDYAESLVGYKRFFTLENFITKTLFDIANAPPKEWMQIKLQCVRRDRIQKVGGAIRSAILAAAFQIQSHNMRAAQNHEIQATGSILTKRLQCRMWELQPAGPHPWQIQPFNIHDEIMAPVREALEQKLCGIVRNFILVHRSLIPLLQMKFVTKMKSWAEK